MKIDLTPRPSALIESLRSIGYSLNTALADIIDNGVTAESSKISVRFEWEKKNSWIAVIDDGIGMSKEGLIEAMRFGSKSPTETRHADDLGRFGLGLKTASISQCGILTVATMQKNKVNGCTLDLENMNNSWSGQFHGKSAISRDKLLQSLISNLEKAKQSRNYRFMEKVGCPNDANFLGSKRADPLFSAAMANANASILKLYFTVSAKVRKTKTRLP